MINRVTMRFLTYNAYGAMTSFGEDTYSYDGFGRLTEHRIGTNVRQYKYDYRNRLKEIWKDSYGGKISKATTPIYSGGLSVVDGSKLYRGVDMGGGVGGLLYEDRLNGDVSFKTSNIRGDIMTNINETRSTADGPNDTMTTETIDYGTFGEGNRYNGNYDENYRANSKREDMGLINDGHRWRNANLNMFLVPDPLEYPDGLNTYIYCNQNPWTRFDPTGLADVTLAAGTGYVYRDLQSRTVSTTMKFNISNINNLRAGRQYTMLREVKVTVNGKSDTVVVGSVFTAEKNTNLDMRVFLNDKHNENFLDNDEITKNVVTANVNFAIVEGNVTNKMKKSDVVVADCDKSTDKNASVTPKNQNGKIAFYAEDSTYKIQAHSARGIKLSNFTKGEKVVDSGSFSYQNKMTNSNMVSGKNIVSGTGIKGDLFKESDKNHPEYSNNNYDLKVEK